MRSVAGAPEASWEKGNVFPTLIATNRRVHLTQAQHEVTTATSSADSGKQYRDPVHYFLKTFSDFSRGATGTSAAQLPTAMCAPSQTVIKIKATLTLSHSWLATID